MTTKTETQIQELKAQREALNQQIQKLEIGNLKRKGVLKQNEWALATFEEFDEETGKWVPAESDPVILFGKNGDTIVAMNSYTDDSSSLIQTWIDDNTHHWERVKVKKITKEEAFALL